MSKRLLVWALLLAGIVLIGHNMPDAGAFWQSRDSNYNTNITSTSSCNSGFPSISGIVGRYLACVGVTGSPVTSVIDQSGTSNANITNLSGTVPFNSSSGYNSHPAFVPNAAGVLASTSFNLNSTTEATVCMPVIFNDTTSTFKQLAQLTTTSYPTNQILGFLDSPATVFDNGLTTVTTTVAASTKYRTCLVAGGATVSSGPCASHTGTGDLELWIGTGSGAGNAMSCVSASNFISVGFNSGTTNSFSIGGNNNGTSWTGFISATIPEVDVFSNHQLTPTEFGNLDAYYQSNYGS